MGVSLSKTSIYIATPQQVAAGTALEGSVLLNLLEPRPTSGIYFELTGFDECNFEEDRTESETVNGESRSRTVTHYYQSSHVFFKTSFCLWEIPSDHLQPGQYSIPFSILLPQVAHSQPIDIYTGVHPSIPDQPICHEENKSVNFCCCCSRGRIHSRVHLDKSSFRPGELANVVAEISNQSSESINRVDVKLTRFITLVGRSMHSGHTERKVVRDVMHSQSFEGVPPHTSFTDQDAKYMPLSLPMVLTPDTNSQSVACRHEIDVVFVPDGCCLGSVQARVPIYLRPHVNSMDASTQQYLVNPASYPGWHGQQLAPAATPSAPELYQLDPILGAPPSYPGQTMTSPPPMQSAPPPMY